jgi:glycosyltransferase involved in cell wall biosynthesis
VAQRLQARGHAVTVLARGEAFGPWTETTVAGLRVRCYPHYPLQPFHHVLARSELAAWLRAGADGADLLHAHLPLLPPLPTELPVVATFHSPMLHDTRAIPEPGLRPVLIKANARLFSRRYEQGYLDRATCVVAVSRQVAADLAASYRLRGRQPVVIPNGVDTGCFDFAPLAGRGRSVLYVGRLGYRKGLFRLLAAFARLPQEPGLELTLAGEGPLELALRHQAMALGIARRVRFTGFLDVAGVRRELHEAGCFVTPADYETGPLTLLEAMACGTPVVTTATGLAAEMGPPTPLLVSDPAPEALAGAIRVTLAEPMATAARAREARALVVARYGWERVVDRLEAVYGVRQEQAA